MTNFADIPLSIDELRAGKSDSASDISPRSTLIAMLRQIDKGEIEPEVLVIAWASKIGDKNTRTSGWSASSNDLLASIGILTRTAFRMMRCED